MIAPERYCEQRNRIHATLNCNFPKGWCARKHLILGKPDVTLLGTSNEELAHLAALRFLGKARGVPKGSVPALGKVQKNQGRFSRTGEYQTICFGTTGLEIKPSDRRHQRKKPQGAGIVSELPTSRDLITGLALYACFYEKASTGFVHAHIIDPHEVLTLRAVKSVQFE
jgi:hypothetical protein